MQDYNKIEMLYPGGNGERGVDTTEGTREIKTGKESRSTKVLEESKKRELLERIVQEYNKASQ